MMKDYNGYLISFEGVDGSGKTTLLYKVEKYLCEQHQLDVITTREPGGTPIGDQVRDLLHDMENIDMTHELETLLYQGSRAELCQKIIEPSLDEGKIVLSDRFRDSGVVYQGYARGMGAYWLDQLSDFTTRGLVPDLTILIDLGAKLGLSRIKDREELNRMDLQRDSFYHRVRRAYLTLHNTDMEGRWELVDGSKSEERVFEQTREIIDRRLFERELLEGNMNPSKERF